MAMGKLNQAADRFMAADERGDSPVINNNLGAVARMKGNLTDASRYLAGASGAGDAVQYNKAILAIQEGNYSQAVSNFSGENTVNAALAKLLNGDANGAKTILNNSDDDSAVAHYVMAVANAHSATPLPPSEHRDLAVQKDAAVRQGQRRPRVPRPRLIAADCIQKAPAASADRGFFMGHRRRLPSPALGWAKPWR